MANLPVFTVTCPAQKEAGFCSIKGRNTGVILSLPKWEIALKIVKECPHGRDIVDGSKLWAFSLSRG